jgi:hypothetical protein
MNSDLVAFRLRASLRRLADEAAAANGVSLSSLIRTYVALGLQTDGANLPDMEPLVSRSALASDPESAPAIDIAALAEPGRLAASQRELEASNKALFDRLAALEGDKAAGAKAAPASKGKGKTDVKASDEDESDDKGAKAKTPIAPVARKWL